MNKILMVGRHISRYSAALHTHKNYKLIYCTAGGGRVQLQSDAYGYTRGDLVIIAPETLHVNLPAQDFNGIYLSIDQVPFKVEQLLIVSDSESHALEQCLAQINYFHNADVFNKEDVLASYSALLSNLVISFSALKKTSPAIEQVKDAIFKHFSESAFDINTLLAQEERYNPNYLKKLFKKEVGTSPQQFLIQVRLTHATHMLSEDTPENTPSIAQVAYACGYDDPLYFSRAFKTHYGVSPKAFFQEMHC